jgi:hypothetical protein
MQRYSKFRCELHNAQIERFAAPQALLISLTPSKISLQTHSTSDSWRQKAAYSATQKLAPPPYPAHVHILQKPKHQEQHVKNQTANGQVLESRYAAQKACFKVL